jgi:putative lipoic acid-binding regulatory protein
MKKLSLLAIIFGLFLALSVSAQVKAPQNEKDLTTEQKMLPFAMSMALSVIGEMHDEGYLQVLTIFQRQLPHWSNELKPVVEMDKNVPDYKRLDISLTATKALRAKSNDSDKWQMLVGEQFGTIYAMIKKNRTESKEINADDLKFNLELIGILANKAPADVPWNVTAKFKEIGKLAEEKNLTSDKNIEKIIDEVKNILNTISKSKEK